MFMSTRYSKRTPEASSRKIFSVGDSLAKLCEYLPCEFSCNKLITCKYKEFNSSKIKFEQKTRLNNAIWRAWHIQYKQNKKARFLQFAAPFSDENTHSTSQAVILDGKYWKRRLDKVSGEHKKWRRDLEERLLRSGGLSREQLEVEASETDTDDDVDVETSGDIRDVNLLSNEPLSTSSSHDSFETFRAMNAHPDTLFSCVEKQDSSLMDDQDLALFKDSSGMIQPTLVQLNPCFDELMNFDFLFTDFNSSTPYSSNLDDGSSTSLPQMLLNLKEDQFLPAFNEKKNIDTPPGLGDLNTHLNALPNPLPETIIPYHSSEGRISAQPLPAVKDTGMRTPKHEIRSSYDDLPPQLQAPNLTATLQAAMSNRPKPLYRNKSDTNLSAMSKRSKKDAAGNGPTVKKVRRNASNPSLPEVGKPSNAVIPETNKCVISSQQQQAVTQQHVGNIISNQQSIVTNIKISTGFVQSCAGMVPKTIQSHVDVPSQAVTLPSAVPQKAKMNSNQQAFHPYTRITSSAEDFVHSIRVPSHPVSTIAKIAPMPSTNQQLLYPSPSVLVVPPQRSVQPNNSNNTRNSMSAFSSLQQQQRHEPHQQLQQQSQQQYQQQQPQQLQSQLHLQSQQQQPVNSREQRDHQGASTIGLMVHNTNEQVTALSQMIQNSPVQTGGEVTLSYLQMLQQQLNVIMKQQEEQIQLKYQLQQQAQKILELQEKQSQCQHQQPSLNASLPCTSIVATSSFTPRAVMGTTSSSQFIVGESNPIVRSSKSSADGTASATSVLRLRTKDTPSVQLTTSTIIPCSSPKSLTKSKSLVRRLHAMGDPQVSHEQMVEPFTTAVTSIERTHSLSTSTPTTLDSAMALVSLQTSVDLCTGLSKVETLSPMPSSPDTVHTDIPVQPVQPKRSEPVESTDISEQRRRIHLSAEQKRRCLIKNSFEELGRILPYSNPEDGKSGKLSNAAILERTCEHIIYLQREGAALDARMNQIRDEIDMVNTAISTYQDLLPAAGARVRQTSSNNMHQTFFSFCKELIYMNSKSWLFCVLMRPLFESFNKAVNTKTVEDFLNSLRQWVDEHCTLPVLRPLVLDSLTKLSMSSSVLEDPSCIHTLARSSLHREDPTVICNDNSDNGGNTSTSQLGDTKVWEESFWHK